MNKLNRLGIIALTAAAGCSKVDNNARGPYYYMQASVHAPAQFIKSRQFNASRLAAIDSASCYGGIRQVTISGNDQGEDNMKNIILNLNNYHGCDTYRVSPGIGQSTYALFTATGYGNFLPGQLNGTRGNIIVSWSSASLIKGSFTFGNSDSSISFSGSFTVPIVHY